MNNSYYSTAITVVLKSNYRARSAYEWKRRQGLERKTQHNVRVACLQYIKKQLKAAELNVNGSNRAL